MLPLGSFAALLVVVPEAWLAQAEAVPGHLEFDFFPAYVACAMQGFALVYLLSKRIFMSPLKLIWSPLLRRSRPPLLPI